MYRFTRSTVDRCFPTLEACIGQFGIHIDKGEAYYVYIWDSTRHRGHINMLFNNDGIPEFHRYDKEGKLRMRVEATSKRPSLIEIAYLVGRLM